MRPSDPFKPFEDMLKADGAPPLLIETFRHHYTSFLDGRTEMIPLSEVAEPKGLPEMATIGDTSTSGTAALQKTLMLKLNGGLGTGMGLDRAKSLLPVKQGLSFLDIIAGQVLHLRKKHQIALPLLMMNSFSTESDSLQVVGKYPDLEKNQRGIPLSFLQHRVPKILQENLAPVRWPQDPEKEWCPPGHGDLYTALITTGLLRRLLDNGFEYVFVSNADNLGATLDLQILGFFADRALPFLMEVTQRTEADRKGGHLAKHTDGRLLLRELTLCPPDEVEDFQDIRKHRYFNTNNLWINLRAVDKLFAQPGRIPDLTVIVNRKTVDPRDAASPAVVQLETAMGSAISVFKGAQAMVVPRTRFSPVKTTDDLLGLWSDAYDLTPEYHLTLNKRRNGVPPVIKLDPRFYRIIDDFTERFSNGAPSLIECQALTLEGDIRFGRNIRVKGSVTLRNNDTTQMSLADGSVYTGN